MAELKKTNVKSKAEAVLFSAGHKISLDEISKLCRAKKEDILAALQELKREYDEKQSSLMLIEEGDFWKFTVQDQFVPIIRRIVTETELTKSVLETLAVIAFKYPILQSDLIKLRTNKAYDHLVELEAAGYITRQKHGRTNLIKLTEKFFKYFDLTEEKLRDKFKDFGSIAKAIKDKEEEIERIKGEQRKRAEDLSKQDERIKKEIEELDEIDEDYKVPLDEYKTKEQLYENTAKEEKIGDLEVVELQQKQKEVARKEDDGAFADENIIKQEEDKKQSPEQNMPEQHKQIQKIDEKKSKGIKLTPEQEVRVDKRVEEIVQGKESKEEKKVV